MSESAAVPAAAPEAPAAADPNQQAQPEVEPWRKAKHQVKVNGAEAEIDYDELVKGYQNAKSADQKYQKAASTEKMMSDFLTQVRKDPGLWMQFAEQTGIYDQVLSTAEQRLVHKYEMEALKASDPEKYELVMAKHERDQMKTEAEKRAEKERQEKSNQDLESFGQEIETEIIQSLQEQGVKPTPRTIARAAEYLLASLDRPGGRMKASEAFQRVQKDYAHDLKDYLTGIGDDALMSFLGDDVRKRIRSFEVKQVRGSQAGGAKPPTQAEAKPVPRDQRPNVDDWFKKREDFFRKK
jgi:hypothetical protein